MHFISIKSALRDKMNAYFNSPKITYDMKNKDTQYNFFISNLDVNKVGYKQVIIKTSAEPT